VTAALLAAFSWEPQVKGALYVVIAVVILVGSCYLLLATNMGARLGFLLAAAGLFGWLATAGMIWWAYGRGPVGPEATWQSETIVTGNPARSSFDALKGFPKGWKKLPPTDKEVADASPVADGELVSKPGGKAAPFKSASEFVVIGAYEKGGKAFGPLGLNVRPFNVFHTAHYLGIQVQKAIPQTPVQGQPAAKPAPDPSAPPVTVILVRNLGAKRLHPAVFTISTTLMFLLICYQLHTRDKEAMAQREGEPGRLQPVGSSSR
jgi:hypothetical protein